MVFLSQELPTNFRWKNAGQLPSGDADFAELVRQLLDCAGQAWQSEGGWMDGWTDVFGMIIIFVS